MRGTRYAGVRAGRKGEMAHRPCRDADLTPDPLPCEGRGRRCAIRFSAPAEYSLEIAVACPSRIHSGRHVGTCADREEADAGPTARFVLDETQRSLQ